MEDLNKNQIVLLTLLVSFVTSIATGIMTVSLLQEAPIEVTRNINSIVEKTIQTVTTPGTVVNAPQQKEVTTVVVREDDMVMSSIDKNVKSIVRINEKDVTGVSTFYGIGLVINKDGLIGADKKIITAGNIYTAKMSDGAELALNPFISDKLTNYIFFKAVQQGTTTVSSLYSFAPAILGDSEPKLGQTLTGLGGEQTNSVGVGRVVSLDVKESGTGTSTVKYLATIVTDISGGSIVDGSPIFNLSGDIVGINLSANSSKTFTPVSVLKKELSSFLDSQKTQ